MDSPPENRARIDRSPRPSDAGPGGSLAAFDLSSEATDLAGAAGPERTARTLVRLDTLRLTLVRLKAGSTVKAHRSEHQISVYTVSGHVLLRAGRDRLDLPAGCVAVLERDLVHDIVPRVDSAVLITVSVSRGSAARA